jgi:hypothetical protein
LASTAELRAAASKVVDVVEKMEELVDRDYVDTPFLLSSL